MMFFRKLTLATQLSVWTVLLLIVALPLTGYWAFSSVEQYLIDQEEKLIEEKITQLSETINLQFDLEQQKLNHAIEIAEYFLLDEALISVSDSGSFEVEGINEINKEQDLLKIRPWLIDNHNLFQNTDVLEEIYRITQAQITVFQKTNKGYVRISTNTVDNEGNNATGYFIPNNHRIFQFIENGKTYRGFLNSVLGTKQGTYKPLYIDNRIQGMIAVEMDKIINEKVRGFFYETFFNNSGMVYLSDLNGKIIIHEDSNLEGTNISDRFDLKKLSTFSPGKIRFEKFYNKTLDNTFEEKQLAYSYLKAHHSFLVVEYDTAKMISAFTFQKTTLVIFVLVLVLVIVLIIHRAVQQTEQNLNLISSKIERTARGEIVESSNHIATKELENISKAVNQLSDGISRTLIFAEDIKNGNFESEYKALGENDALGKSLLDMRESLIKAKEVDEKRKAEDLLREWHNNGLAKFNEILRYQEDADRLSYEIIKNLVEYLGANQGGLFLMEDGHDRKVLKLLAAHAYNEQKLIQKEIPVNVGVIGRAVLEERSIYLEEIPADYLEITSGLGHEKPGSLLLVPLVFSGEIMGVIEIAAFKPLEKHHVRFLEQVGESIASTLINLRINSETKVLLDKTREQSNQMAVQEEKLRGNLEELKHLQFQTQEQSLEMEGVLNGVKSSVMMAEFDMEGNILEINDRFLSVFGLNREDAIGRNRTEFAYLAVEKAKFQKLWAEMKKGNSVSRIEYYKMPNGEEVWLTENYTPILDKNKKLHKVLDIALDISKTKEQQEQFKQQTEQLQKQEIEIKETHKKLNAELEAIQVKDLRLSVIIKAFDHNLIHLDYNLDFTILELNSVFYDLFDYRKKDVEGRSLLDIVSGDNIDKIKNQFATISRGEHSLLILKLKTRIGSTKWIKTLLIPIFDKNKLIEKISFFGVDITQEKMEQELAIDKIERAKRIEKELHENIAILAKKMEDSQKEIEEKRKTIDALKKQLGQ